MIIQPKPRSILIGSRIDCEEAARQISECASYAELAARWGKTEDRIKHIVLELRDLGYDCGVSKTGPKPKARQ